MATLWSTFTFWEQAFVVVLGAVLVLAAAGWFLAQLADNVFDEDALDEQRPEGE